ncbi:MAG: hydroxymethylglutaryl-CoA reductase, degradative [Halobacteriovorax sp.]|nr:hydroxymethylglutaryl-CoA reductase, degradative [Halobacteriovorax sp.]
MGHISGFSKMTKIEKIDFLSREFFDNAERSKQLLKSFWHPDANAQKIFDEFSENTLTNFVSPYGVVPNLDINGKTYCVPLVIEESSVVAAASKAAKFWSTRGGFKAEVISTLKAGQVHMIWEGENVETLQNIFETNKDQLIEEVKPLTTNMEKRGGGLKSIKLIDRRSDEPGYFQLWAEFETCDAMGANFINSVLESLGQSFKNIVAAQAELSEADRKLQVIMAILSNYTPNCLVKVSVSCPVSELHDPGHGMDANEFADKFARAVRIAKIDVNRATTHNKGIFNGVDAVVLATGNDFRAVEACGHTWAARDGQYRGLSDCSVEDGIFTFSLELPLSIGTVGGLTALHPMAKFSLDMLGNPSAPELMQIIVTTGLAQNFAALRSLVTSGIQKGHMKMHLMNILNHLEANESERAHIKDAFKHRVISFRDVRAELALLRKYQ